MTIVTLKRRQDFLKAARARRCRRTAFTLLANKRTAEKDADCMRLGLTCSKRIGGAVLRNRAKRRLREAARIALPQYGHLGWDYVLIGIPHHSVNQEFSSLLSDLCTALRRIHDPTRPV